MVIFSRLSPDSVKIISRQVCSIISVKDSIHVYHRHHIKMIVLFPGIIVALKQPLNDTLCNVGPL